MLTSLIQAAKKDIANPIGSILAFAGPKENKPEGWEVCDGKLLEISKFSELYNKIGLIWGKGDNDLEFRIPNLQGQFLRGVDYEQTTDPHVLDRKNALSVLSIFQDLAAQGVAVMLATHDEDFLKSTSSKSRVRQIHLDNGQLAKEQTL